MRFHRIPNTVYQIGRKSTSLETTHLIYDAVDDDYYAAWVWDEERDRRRARAVIPDAYARMKRTLALARSS